MMTIDELTIGTPTMPTVKPAPTIQLAATRDLMHQTLMSKVRFNRYDMKFMANIYERYVSTDKPLSAGQNTLYEKIVHKYRKQLKKLKINYKDVLALSWENGIVSSEVLKQQTYFRLEHSDNDTVMQLSFNFNKALIEEVRALVHDDNANHLNKGAAGNFGNGQKYEFRWNNATKVWSGPFNVYLFKTLYEFAERSNIKIDDSVLTVVNQLNETGTKSDWTPSIRVSNDRLYVNCIAESMLPVLESLDLSDISFANIERIAALGLMPPDEFAHIADYVITKSPTHKHVISTIDDMRVFKEYITISDRKTLFFMPELAHGHRAELPSVKELKICNAWNDSIRLLDGTSSANAEMIDKCQKENYNTLVITTPLTSLVRSQAEIGTFALEADKVIYLSLEEK